MDTDRRAKVMLIEFASLADILGGRAKIKNMPRDARIVGAHIADDGRRIALRVHSQDYSPTPHGHPLPVSVAVVER
jgi:hypothetical protein